MARLAFTYGFSPFFKLLSSFLSLRETSKRRVNWSHLTTLSLESPQREALECYAFSGLFSSMSPFSTKIMIDQKMSIFSCCLLNGEATWTTIRLWLS